MPRIHDDEGGRGTKITKINFTLEKRFNSETEIF